MGKRESERRESIYGREAEERWRMAEAWRNVIEFPLFGFAFQTSEITGGRREGGKSGREEGRWGRSLPRWGRGEPRPHIREL